MVPHQPLPPTARSSPLVCLQHPRLRYLPDHEIDPPRPDSPNNSQRTRRVWMKRKCRIHGMPVHSYYLEHHPPLVCSCLKKPMGCLLHTRTSGRNLILLPPTSIPPLGQSHIWIRQPQSKLWHRRLFSLLRSPHQPGLSLLKPHHLLALFRKLVRLPIRLLLKWGRLSDQSLSRLHRLLVRLLHRQLSFLGVMLDHRDDLRYVCLKK